MGPMLSEETGILIRQAKKEFPGQFWGYPLDTGLSEEEFVADLKKRLAEARAKRDAGKSENEA